MMPSLRKKVAGFIRQLSVSNPAENSSAGQYDSSETSSGCFIQRYLRGHDVRGNEPVILHGRNPQELPAKCLGSFATGNQSIVAASTGPDGGLTTVNLRQQHFSTSDPDVDYIDILDQQAERENNTDHSSALGRNEDIAGVCDWFRSHNDAFGAATTLYERHPITNENAGNPIADCFAVVARENSAILALADGVNWGEKACVAARSAIHGCVEYLNKALFNPGVTTALVTNTTDVFVALLRSFHAAHSLILQEEGMLTTLTAAVVLPLKSSDKYVVCVCNVGDSLAYVYSHAHGVREVTKGSHDIHCMRDMRDALGALGPVDGKNPELNNLTCSMTEVEEGDIVFVTSDGVSDNFDPVVGKFAVLPPSQESEPSNVKSTNQMKTSSSETRQHATNSKAPINGGLPTVEAFQRHELSLLRMDDLLKNGVSGNGPPCSDAKTLCEMLLDFAVRLTAAKRHILEDPDLYYTVSDNSSEQIMELSRTEQRTRRKKVCEKLAMVPGKLDHATVVAYKVGIHERSTNNELSNKNKKSGDDVLLETVL